jgi:hypothetical protein
MFEPVDVAAVYDRRTSLFLSDGRGPPLQSIK